MKVKIKGVARLDRRTKNLISRVCRGEIAILDHEDIDEVACDALILARVRGVVNVKSSITGKYYNPGPLNLCDAGIRLLDCVGPRVMEAVRDGDVVEIIGNTLRKNGTIICQGTILGRAEVLERLKEARTCLADRVDAFVLNTMEHAKQERSLILRDITFPELRTRIAGRHVLVVARGRGYHDDLRAVIPYIYEMRPVVIAVDGAADTLLRFGVLPHIIVGDMDSASDRALKHGSELVVHVYPSGHSPGRERLKQLSVEAVECQVPGLSEDLALLLAYEKGAELIVIVGSHSSVEDFLDKGRQGMSSTFLTRLKVGSVLIDAKGVSKLYKNSARGRDIAKVALAGLVPLSTSVAASQTLRQFLRLIIMQLKLATWPV
ncbi:MAG TPA: hypothetical protein GX721_05755 [Firmicutes bacterium]|jgi:uncharacterized membrane-anchored protein|nr:hypothetical protein [Bacillota bacterium]